ncbi:MAG: hypothetical protein V7672_08175 [Brevundimonas sp.]|uniref:hypothetical protein n=1 Tax=Brevundimonas sp. TaxID=1871086 RepID=UPI003001455D
MTFLKSLAATAVAFALVPAVAQAQAVDPQLALFQSTCVETDGQASAAMAKLDAAGWDVLPPEMMGADAPFDNMQARLLFADEGIQIAMTGDMAEGLGTLTDGGEMYLAVCAVGVMPGDYAAIDGAVADWLDMTPNAEMSEAGLNGYPYTIENGRKVAVAEDLGEEAMLELAAGDKMRIVMTGDTDGVIMIMYMRPQPR